MARQRHRPKGRLLITGTILLILLVAGILIAGRTINSVAMQMSERIVTHISEYHYRLLQVEFERSEGVLEASAQFMREQSAPTEAERHVLAATLMRMDPKAGCVWFAEAGGRTIRSYPRAAEPRTTATDRDFRQQLIATTDGDSVYSRVTDSGRIQVWSMARTVTDRAGRRHICGIDFPLSEIYTRMTQNPASSGYAMLFDPEGVIVYHPDSLKMGHPANDPAGRAAFRKVVKTGRSLTVHAISDYLDIDEERTYYPMRLGGERWVAGIGIPRLVIEQEIDEFHFYTVFASVISVLFFAVLLVLAQRRWRREYDLRRHSEQESAQLHLQQLLEQIDPHFLFNSLNSLYALIRSNPEQAREFTLTLSRVYRRVLEHRKQILATLAEEIDFTWQYYTLQKIRFDDRIELTTAIDPALRNWRIPSMSLQTLVENAVKHNSITGGNPLHIRISTEGESLLIENNYTPRNDGDKESLGLGLERIRSVYRFYTEENISISIDKGTFRCRMPMLPPEK
ncbi:histidine kinase [Alistipes sp.]|uniref:histidine kinase n=1 Tax=Alistipes sp. TaxID=1872444 RepID=UPI0025C1BFFE|nr:histidine kinase [Alistipes sp.]